MSKDLEEDEYIDGDTFANQYSADCALMSAGGTIRGLETLFDKKDPCHGVFAAVRPPGHHASVEEEGGFCFFNNVAVAARYA